MALKDELGLKKPFSLLGHEALLNVYFTASQLRKKASDFLQPFGLTDVHFNLMMLLKHQSGSDDGLNQAQLSHMMLVNRANITSVVDRMQRAGLVTRNATPSDRRYNIIKLTERGKKLLDKIEPLYIKEVKKIMGALKKDEQERLIEMLGKVRNNIS